MFQITTNTTLPDIYIENRQLISIPCFYLNNNSSSTSFVPMFVIESTDEEVLDIENFSYVLSTTPSEFLMLEINIEDLQPLEDISTLYINGVPYQNLLDVEDLVIFNTQEDTLPLQEREST